MVLFLNNNYRLINEQNFIKVNEDWFDLNCS